MNNVLTKVFTVTFVTGDGASAAPEAQTVVLNAKATAPADPTKTGYNFQGWFAEGATAAFDFDTAITADITLTAGWSQKVVKMVVGETTTYYDYSCYFVS